jgi:hypothetical protein
MPEVYVVRQFFEGCSDASYTGVYSDFFKAILAAGADAKESWGDPGYTFNAHKPRGEGETELWCEIFFEGRPNGIYYTITKMELDK